MKLSFVFKYIVISISIFCFASVNNINSQTEDFVFEVGKKYKVVLFDDTEIIGVVKSLDSNNVKIQTTSGETVFVFRENILYATTDTTPGKYSVSLSLLGGISLQSEENYNYYYYSGHGESLKGPHINLSSTYYFSNSKGIKVDLGYSGYTLKEDVTTDYNGYPRYYSGGKITYVYFKPNFILGTFNPKNKVNAYGSFGLGIHYTSEEERSERIYDSWDSTYRTYTYPERNYVNAIISIGGGIGYRFSKNLAITAEVEYNMVTYDGSFLIFWGGRSGYFPLRLGITYLLY